MRLRSILSYIVDLVNDVVSATSMMLEESLDEVEWMLE